MAEPYAAPSAVRAFYAGEDTPSALYGPYMRMAANLVQRFAPVPDPVPADYEQMAIDAELLIGQYLFNSQAGGISSVGAEGLSLSLTNFSAVKNIVAQAMGSYSTVGRARIRHLERG